MAFTISAALMHSYTVDLVAFIEEFGWSRAETSLAHRVAFILSIASYLCGGVAFWALRRPPVRRSG